MLDISDDESSFVPPGHLNAYPQPTRAAPPPPQGGFLDLTPDNSEETSHIAPPVFRQQQQPPAPPAGMFRPPQPQAQPTSYQLPDQGLDVTPDDSGLELSSTQLPPPPLHLQQQHHQRATTAASAAPLAQQQLQRNTFAITPEVGALVSQWNADLKGTLTSASPSSGSGNEISSFALAPGAPPQQRQLAGPAANRYPLPTAAPAALQKRRMSLGLTPPSESLESEAPPVQQQQHQQQPQPPVRGAPARRKSLGLTPPSESTSTFAVPTRDQALQKQQHGAAGTDNKQLYQQQMQQQQQQQLLHSPTGILKPLSPLQISSAAADSPESARRTNKLLRKDSLAEGEFASVQQQQQQQQQLQNNNNNKPSNVALQQLSMALTPTQSNLSVFGSPSPTSTVGSPHGSPMKVQATAKGAQQQQQQRQPDALQLTPPSSSLSASPSPAHQQRQHQAPGQAATAAAAPASPLAFLDEDTSVKATLQQKPSRPTAKIDAPLAFLGNDAKATTIAQKQKQQQLARQTTTSPSPTKSAGAMALSDITPPDATEQDGKSPRGKEQQQHVVGALGRRQSLVLTSAVDTVHEEHHHPQRKGTGDLHTQSEDEEAMTVGGRLVDGGALRSDKLQDEGELADAKSPQQAQLRQQQQQQQQRQQKMLHEQQQQQQQKAAEQKAREEEEENKRLEEIIRKQDEEAKQQRLAEEQRQKEELERKQKEEEEEKQRVEKKRREAEEKKDAEERKRRDELEQKRLQEEQRRKEEEEMAKAANEKQKAFLVAIFSLEAEERAARQTSVVFPWERETVQLKALEQMDHCRVAGLTLPANLHTRTKLQINQMISEAADRSSLLHLEERTFFVDLRTRLGYTNIFTSWYEQALEMEKRQKGAIFKMQSKEMQKRSIENVAVATRRQHIFSEERERIDLISDLVMEGCFVEASVENCQVAAAMGKRRKMLEDQDKERREMVASALSSRKRTTEFEYDRWVAETTGTFALERIYLHEYLSESKKWKAMLASSREIAARLRAQRHSLEQQFEKSIATEVRFPQERQWCGEIEAEAAFHATFIEFKHCLLKTIKKQFDAEGRKLKSAAQLREDFVNELEPEAREGVLDEERLYRARELRAYYIYIEGMPRIEKGEPLARANIEKDFTAELHRLYEQLRRVHFNDLQHNQERNARYDVQDEEAAALRRHFDPWMSAIRLQWKSAELVKEESRRRERIIRPELDSAVDALKKHASKLLNTNAREQFCDIREPAGRKLVAEEEQRERKTVLHAVAEKGKQRLAREAMEKFWRRGGDLIRAEQETEALRIGRDIQLYGIQCKIEWVCPAAEEKARSAIQQDELTIRNSQLSSTHREVCRNQFVDRAVNETNRLHQKSLGELASLLQKLSSSEKEQRRIVQALVEGFQKEASVRRNINVQQTSEFNFLLKKYASFLKVIREQYQRRLEFCIHAFHVFTTEKLDFLQYCEQIQRTAVYTTFLRLEMKQAKSQRQHLEQSEIFEREILFRKKQIDKFLVRYFQWRQEILDEETNESVKLYSVLLNFSSTAIPKHWQMREALERGQLLSAFDRVRLPMREAAHREYVVVAQERSSRFHIERVAMVLSAVKGKQQLARLEKEERGGLSAKLAATALFDDEASGRGLIEETGRREFVEAIHAASQWELYRDIARAIATEETSSFREISFMHWFRDLQRQCFTEKVAIREKEEVYNRSALCLILSPLLARAEKQHEMQMVVRRKILRDYATWRDELFELQRVEFVKNVMKVRSSVWDEVTLLFGIHCREEFFRINIRSEHFRSLQLLRHEEIFQEEKHDRLRLERQLFEVLRSTLSYLAQVVDLVASYQLSDMHNESRLLEECRKLADWPRLGSKESYSLVALDASEDAELLRLEKQIVLEQKDSVMDQQDEKDSGSVNVNTNNISTSSSNYVTPQRKIFGINDDDDDDDDNSSAARNRIDNRNVNALLPSDDRNDVDAAAAVAAAKRRNKKNKRLLQFLAAQQIAVDQRCNNLSPKTKLIDSPERHRVNVSTRLYSRIMALRPRFDHRNHPLRNEVVHRSLTSTDRERERLPTLLAVSFFSPGPIQATEKPFAVEFGIFTEVSRDENNVRSAIEMQQMLARERLVSQFVVLQLCQFEEIARRDLMLFEGTERICLEEKRHREHLEERRYATDANFWWTSKNNDNVLLVASQIRKQSNAKKRRRKGSKAEKNENAEGEVDRENQHPHQQHHQQQDDDAHDDDDDNNNDDDEDENDDSPVLAKYAYQLQAVDMRLQRAVRDAEARARAILKDWMIAERIRIRKRNEAVNAHRARRIICTLHNAGGRALSVNASNFLLASEWQGPDPIGHPDSVTALSTALATRCGKDARSLRLRGEAYMVEVAIVYCALAETMMWPIDAVLSQLEPQEQRELLIEAISHVGGTRSVDELNFDSVDVIELVQIADEETNLFSPVSQLLGSSTGGAVLLQQQKQQHQHLRQQQQQQQQLSPYFFNSLWNGSSRDLSPRLVRNLTAVGIDQLNHHRHSTDLNPVLITPPSASEGKQEEWQRKEASAKNTDPTESTEETRNERAGRHHIASIEQQARHALRSLFQDETARLVESWTRQKRQNAIFAMVDDVERFASDISAEEQSVRMLALTRHHFDLIRHALSREQTLTQPEHEARRELEIEKSKEWQQIFAAQLCPNSPPPLRRHLLRRDSTETGELSSERGQHQRIAATSSPFPVSAMDAMMTTAGGGEQKQQVEQTRPSPSTSEGSMLFTVRKPISSPRNPMCQARRRWLMQKESNDDTTDERSPHHQHPLEGHRPREEAAAALQPSLTKNYDGDNGQKAAEPDHSARGSMCAQQPVSDGVIPPPITALSPPPPPPCQEPVKFTPQRPTSSSAVSRPLFHSLSGPSATAASANAGAYASAQSPFVNVRPRTASSRAAAVAASGPGALPSSARVLSILKKAQMLSDS